MPKLSKKPSFLIGIGLIIFISLLFTLLAFFGVFSEKKLNFNDYLKQIDIAIQKNDFLFARENISLAKESAKTAENYLSLIKRTRKLLATWDTSSKTTLELKTLMQNLAQEAFFMFPGNNALSTVYASLLSEVGDYEKAFFTLSMTQSAISVQFPVNTTQTSEMSTVAGLLFLNNKLNSPQKTDSELWEKAASIFKKPSWQKNAAVLVACNKGLDSFNNFLFSTSDCKDFELADFWATLSYDSKNFENAYSWASLASLLAATKYDTARAYLLMADSANNAGDLDKAKSAWLYLSKVFPTYSPIPFYNLVKLSSPKMRNKNLRELLKIHPDYVPALQLATKLACKNENSKNSSHLKKAETGIYSDIFTDELSKRGLQTIKMQEALPNSEITFQEVQQAFSSVYKAKTGITGQESYLNTWQISSILPNLSADFLREEFRFYFNSKIEKKTIEEIWKLLESFPNNEELYEYAIWLFLYNKRSDDARHVYEKALEVFADKIPSKTTLFFGGIFACLEGNLSQAKSLFRESITGNDTSWQSLANTALIEKALGNWQEASENLSLAATLLLNNYSSYFTENEEELKKTCATLNYEAGSIFEEHANYKAALISYELALQQDSSNYQARTSLARVRRILQSHN